MEKGKTKMKYIYIYIYRKSEEFSLVKLTMPLCSKDQDIYYEFDPNSGPPNEINNTNG